MNMEEDSSLIKKEIEYLRENLESFSVDNGFCFGYFNGEKDDFEDFLDGFQIINSTCFVKSEGHFKEKGHKRLSQTASPVFEDKRGNIPIELFGYPFTVLSNENRHCIHGSKKDARGGYRKKAQTEHDYSNQSRLHLQSSTKLDCSASIQIRCIRIFSEYHLDLAKYMTKKKRRTEKARLLKQIQETTESNPTHTFSTTTRYYVKIPLASVHTSHPVGQSSAISQYVDKRVVNKVYDLVKKNVTKLPEVKRCLSMYVEDDLFAGASRKPSQTNRRYYPKNSDLRNHIAKAISSFRACTDDQESLKVKIAEWGEKSPESKFFYRAHDELKTEDGKIQEVPFLYVQQEPWQQRLLLRYGSEVAFMDATYKTTKYAIPLFFVCVQTNVGFKVIAQFMCQTEDQMAISEALSILRKWNPTWDPKYFIVDYSSAEIAALEQQFKGVVVYICDFHRIQALQRWAKSGKNGLSCTEQELFISHMQRISYAATKSEYDKAVAALRGSSLYKYKAKVKTYVERTWLACAYRWAHIFRQEQATKIATTNNGVEAQNRLFKYNYLPRTVDKSVFGIAAILFESFLPETYQHYIDTNLKLSSSYRKYSTSVPTYLHDRPPAFIKHCLKSRFAAAEYKEEDVKPVDREKGIFSVKSGTNPKAMPHVVNMQGPSCTCPCWKKSRFPCKHFFLVFSVFDDWGFETLPESYRNSVFITLDNHDVGHKQYNSAKDEDAVVEEEDKEDQAVDAFEFSDMEPGTSPIKAEESGNVKEPPGRISTVKLRKRVQEKLDNLKDTAFLVHDYDMLTKAMRIIESLHAEMKNSCPAVNGLPIRSSPAKKKLKETSVQYHQVFHKALPRRKKWKKKKSAVIDLTLESDKEEERKETEEKEEKEEEKGQKVGEMGGLVVSDEEEAGEEGVEEDQEEEQEVREEETQSDDDQSLTSNDKENEGSFIGDAETEGKDSCNFFSPSSADPCTSQQPQSHSRSNIADPCTRLINANRIGLKLSEVMLEIGPVRLTVTDLWTLLAPDEVKRVARSGQNLLPHSFHPGWLSDTVIEAFLWLLCLRHEDVFAADASMCQIVQNNASTRRLWHGESFANINKIFIPMNISGSHWTLLVLDKANNVRYYFDPMQGKARTISAASNPSLARIVNRLSIVSDSKTGWKSKQWPCVEPSHYKQSDSYNCGIFVCLFARCLCEGVSVAQNFDILIEREKITAEVFGFCYDDIEKRDTGVCKICKDDDEEDWLGCDSCGQFFHASCLNVDFPTSLSTFFKCPK